jgi:hypothetical protein
LRQLPELHEAAGIPDELVRSHLPRVARHRLRAKLREETTLEFIRTPIGDVFDYLSDLHELRFVVEESAAEHELTMTMKGARLETALGAICEPLGLVWLVEPDGVRISTSQAALQRTEARTYELGGLVGDDERAAAEIAAMLPRAVAPDSWQAGGEDAARSITRTKTLLEITHAPLVHQEIEAFLAELGPLGNRRTTTRGEERIERDLAAKCVVEFSKLPLSAALERLAAYHGVAIRLDEPAIKARDIDAKSPVTFTAGDKTLEAALDALLPPLDLVWTIRHETLFVFPGTEAARRLETRVYHVGELLGETRPAAELAEEVARAAKLANLPGRLSAAVHNRIVVRAAFREHRQIEAELERLRQESGAR